MRVPSVPALALAVALALPLSARAGSSAAADDAEASPGQVITVPDGVDKAARFVAHARGTLVVEPDGRVSTVTLDMPRATREIYRQAIAGWRFEPMRVDGAPVRAKARFALTATGTAIPGTDRMRLGIEQVWFMESESLEGEEAERSSSHGLAPPRYPRDAALAGYGGTVAVLVALDDAGRVVDAGIAGVALGRSEIRSERQAVAMARQLADASLAAARGWTIADPAVAGGTAIVPVTFHPPQRPHGGWVPQIPLDVTPLPWMVAAQAEAVALMPGGGAGSTRFRLIDDVAGTTIN